MYKYNKYVYVQQICISTTNMYKYNKSTNVDARV
jgi:hypothetical protein